MRTGDLLSGDLEMTDDIDERAVLDKEIKGMLTASREYRQWWSIATHGSAWAIIAFSAIAAYLTKDSPQAAAILSLLVTIIAAAQIKIGFGRKWALFRIMQTELRLLQLDLETGR